MTEPHGEHHRCARCEAVGRAEAEARLAAVEWERDTWRRELATELEQAQARLAALTAALERARNDLLDLSAQAGHRARACASCDSTQRIIAAALAATKGA